MPYSGTFQAYDGKKVTISDQRGNWFGYPDRTIDLGQLSQGDTVQFEVEKVPSKTPGGKPYNRFTSITKTGAAGFKSARAAAPRVAAPSNGNGDTRDEMIFICGVVNNYVSQTGDTSVKGLTMAALNARQAFRVVLRGEQPARQPEPEQRDMPDDDIPF